MKEDLETKLIPIAKRPNGAKTSGGFSLVEVVLALGVMSFALTAIVGLLPLGLSHFRKAVDLTVQAQITQELTSMIQRTPYSDLDTTLGSSSNPSIFKFDEEGSPSSGDGYVYTATAFLISDSDLNSLLSPTWSTNSSGKTLNNIRAIQITISNRANPANSQTITTYVANTGL